MEGLLYGVGVGVTEDRSKFSATIYTFLHLQKKRRGSKLSYASG